jgi:hypothetical protein
MATTTTFCPPSKSRWSLIDSPVDTLEPSSDDHRRGALGRRTRRSTNADLPSGIYHASAVRQPNV